MLLVCFYVKIKMIFTRKQKERGVVMETPGPLSICITNMVIVFAVLIVLAFIIELIHVVDPTKNKQGKK